MNRLLFFCLALLYLYGCQKAGGPWNQDALKEVTEYANEIGTFGLVIHADGQNVLEFGDIDRVSRLHSVRKAILSASVFQNMDKVDINSTLEDLGIQDYPIPLTGLQTTTKVIHLLKSTSGINHPTSSQIGSMQADRDSLLGYDPNIPGTKWAYNNWDYNVLTTILEQETGMSTLELFEIGIAKPLGMHDYEVFYRGDTSVSKHLKAGFRLSTRDMAKFGQLFLRQGTWDGNQLIPREWIQKISSDFTLTKNQGNERYGHGYLWWIQDETYADGLLPQGSFVATGAWGQRILVIPAWNIVVAHKVMTEGATGLRKKVTKSEFENLVKLIALARNKTYNKQ